MGLEGNECRPVRIHVLTTIRRLCFWPGDRKQEGAFLDRLDVMFQAALQCENIPWPQLGSVPAWKVQSNSSLKAVNRNWTVRMVILHMTSRLHEDKDNSEIRVLYKRLGTTADRLLPGRCIFKLLDLITNIRLDHRVRKLWEPSQAATILTGVAGFLIFNHLGNSPQEEGYKEYAPAIQTAWILST